MNYSGPGFLASPLLPSRQLTRPAIPRKTEKERQVADWRGERRGGQGAESPQESLVLCKSIILFVKQGVFSISYVNTKLVTQGF
jgi:hypothetical protein